MISLIASNIEISLKTVTKISLFVSMETDMKNETFHKLLFVIFSLFLFPNKRKMYRRNGIGISYVNISVKGKAISK
jgi:hypothetical protein